MTKEYFQWTHRVASDYKTYLAQRFQGEVFGHAMFRTMADLCDDPARAQKFRLLEQLERETSSSSCPQCEKQDIRARRAPSE